MNRRTFLTGTAAVLAGTGLAGCSDGANPSGEAGDGGGSESKLEIQSHELYTDDGGTPAGVSGTVKNTTDSELEFAQVEALFFDADGSVVGEGLSDSRTGVAAGERWPFNCIYAGDEADRIEEYEVEASTTA